MIPILNNLLAPIKGNPGILDKQQNGQNEKQKWRSTITTPPNSCITSISIKDKGKIKHIRLLDIVMLEAESNYTLFHICDGSKILTCKTLKNWNDLIGENPNFIRPHRSFLLNKQYIHSIENNYKTIIMNDKSEVKLARRRKLYLL